MVSVGAQGKRDHDLVKNRVLLMGIVNVTPDSFSDGNRFLDHARAIDHALQLAEEGADLLDIGGESTRPGADFVSVKDELARVLPVISGLAQRLKGARISIDTRKADVMRAALAAGAHIVNDVSALQFDEDALSVVADHDCPVILMHGKGDPKTMQDNPVYGDVLQEVHDYLQQRIDDCERAGIARTRLIIDPGIGFGKTLAHNLTLLADLDRLHDLDVPLMLGVSRKRFIGTITNEEDPMQREPGSLSAALHGVTAGAQILRVHDVRKTRQALDVWQAINSAHSTQR